MRHALDGVSRLGVVVHAGAGGAPQLERYLALKAEKVVLVEADPDIAAALRASARGKPEVQVLHAAVAGNAGRVALHVLNNPRESSLLAPAALLELCPNLSVARTIEVPAVTLETILGDLTWNATAENLLVLELQGAEHRILAATGAEALQRFSRIAVRASVERLYQGGARLADVDHALRQANFQLAPLAQDDAAWPFVEVLFQRDDRQLELRRDSEELRRSREEMALELKRARQEAERLARALEKATAEREALAQARLECERLEKAEAALRDELSEARQSAALSTKLQALKEADLRDLQERYRQVLSAQEKQRELLVKLAERLSAASGYFRELTASQPAIAAPAEPAAMPAAKPRVRAARKRAGAKLP